MLVQMDEGLGQDYVAVEQHLIQGPGMKPLGEKGL